MKWITRERVRIDRAASAWLIKKFVDPDAQFLFAPRDQVLAVSSKRAGYTLSYTRGRGSGKRPTARDSRR